MVQGSLGFPAQGCGFTVNLLLKICSNSILCYLHVPLGRKTRFMWGLPFEKLSSEFGLKIMLRFEKYSVIISPARRPASMLVYSSPSDSSMRSTVKSARHVLTCCSLMSLWQRVLFCYSPNCSMGDKLSRYLC